MTAAQTTLAAGAAQELVDRRRQQRRGPLLAAPLRPASIDDALQIQQQVLDLLGTTRGGWKCSVAPAGSAILAPIPLDRISRGDSCSVPLIDGVAPIEPEIAYVIGQDLPPRATPYTETEVLAAIASTHLAFELIASRYAALATEIPDKLADSLSNFGLHLGPQIDGPAALEDIDGEVLRGFKLTLESDGATAKQEWEGKHPDGHPLRALLWLVNYLNGRQTGLRRGEVVTTGSYHGLLQVPANQMLRMQFGTLGKLQVTIRAAT
ncbi:2-keto-4-pentenoate hydratase [Herbaspirillum autotrophicum]|uniref:2-keto-4-pentenoate hydratase n=1 Tax=Herbaspirillum autotrophicum TaxID=180195 RepID=UPI00067B1B78|nr:hypothetical protein [Herbaspirillum autotrophicum]